MRAQKLLELKARFLQQKYQAKSRKIAWKLTFQQWLNIWVASGRLNKRGQRRGQYVMGRYGDVGAYEVNNVAIITNYENNAPGRKAGTAASWALPNVLAPIAVQLVRAKGQQACVRANTGAKRSARTRAKMSEAAYQRDPATRVASLGMLGKHHTEESRAQIAASNRGQKRSAESRAKMRASRLRYLAAQKGGP